MKYPKFIKKGDYIGITAPSAGIIEDYKVLELNNAIKNFENMGYKIVETKNVRTCEKGRSSSAKVRAEQFMELWENDDVSAIICAAGGDFACEMVDYLDFEYLKNTKPKWIQGFSDITNLDFVFTTNLDIATIYGENIRDYGMNELHKTLTDSIELMSGKEIIQNSFGVCEPKDEEKGIFEAYKLTQEICWKNLNGENKVEFSGRALGGCFDVIINLIGTKYDKVKEYIEKYKNDGIVWFLDVFEMSTPQLYCHLWQMKNAGYFEYCKGIIFGRPLIIREDYEMSFEDVIKEALNSLNIPIICDADIGHIPPQMPIVNGAILEVTCENGKGKIVTIHR